MRAGKPGDKSICKWCRRPIFWLDAETLLGGRSRWAHGTNLDDWEFTRCNINNTRNVAEPSEAYLVQQILEKYE